MIGKPLIRQRRSGNERGTMTDSDRLGELDTRFSVSNAVARPWSDVVAGLRAAEIFWLTTVRRDGRPHTVPVLGVWLEPAWYFITGPEEQKTVNLASNPACTVTTGTPLLDGLDVVIEGQATPVPGSNREERAAMAQAFAAHYPAHVAPGAMFEDLPPAIRGADAPVFRVDPKVVFAFVKGDGSAQMRWRF
jgi:nitroimidazol reductase NimA-like FMN-containing flavoprotein (pyridoxamine 5'-phosphate oxidase superfamily)